MERYRHRVCLIISTLSPDTHSLEENDCIHLHQPKVLHMKIDILGRVCRVFCWTFSLQSIISVFLFVFGLVCELSHTLL